MSLPSSLDCSTHVLFMQASIWWYFRLDSYYCRNEIRINLALFCFLVGVSTPTHPAASLRENEVSPHSPRNVFYSKPPLNPEWNIIEWARNLLKSLG